MASPPKRFLSCEMLHLPEVRSAIKASRKITASLSLESLPKLEASNIKIDQEKPRDRSVEHKLVLDRIDSKLLNHRGKLHKRLKEEISAASSFLTKPKRKPIRKASQKALESPNYIEFIKRSSSKWKTLNFATEELKKDFNKKCKENAASRSVMTRLKRKRTISMPNIIAYGSVTAVNSLLDR
mmetsp:Transcript_11996/g.22934  ORF Transcript_11996/g.22934 Transcript_11996/m.22934 type:complete len:183 (-) Transcript_11996:49-597(-)